MKMTLRTKRIDRGLTPSQLAEESGVPVRVIRALESGYRDVNKSQLVTLVRLCYVLECRVSDILTDPELVEKMRECEEN